MSLRKPFLRPLFGLILVAMTSVALAQLRKPTKMPRLSQSREIEGLTEPFKQIDLAPAESGLIAAIEVEEGETVRRGQLLARLDDLVLHTSLRIAKVQMESVGALRTAEAESRMRTNRHEKLAALQKEGHATAEEVLLAQAEMEAAQARVLTARETLEVRKLEHARIAAQIERRLIRSPIDGIVTRVFRDPSEFVSYTDPVVMTVVQLDPLIAVFTGTTEQVRDIRVGQKLTVRLASTAEPAQGEVVYVAPVLDAQSGAVRFKVRIDNKDGRFRSGDKCTLADGKGERPRLGGAIGPRRRQR